MSVSEENKIVAEVALNVFGGKPKVFKYWDDKKESSVDILSCADRPCRGVTSYSTLGLSEYSIGYKSDDIPLRVEVVGVCASNFESFSNILAGCALNIIVSKLKCYPGAIFQNIIEIYNTKSEMKHILFTTPFVWDSELETISFPDKKVTWLLAVPISDKELNYAIDKGIDALESLFVEQEIDIFNINRKSIL